MPIYADVERIHVSVNRKVEFLIHLSFESPKDIMEPAQVD